MKFFEFNKNGYKSVKWTLGTRELEPGDIIQFKNGGRKMFGKVLKLWHNGVQCMTDLGYYNPAWEHIQRTFEKKKITKLRSARIKCYVPTKSVIPVLHTMLDKLVEFIKEKYPDLELKDVLIDEKKEYSRDITLTNGEKFVNINIDNKDTNDCVVTGSEMRKWTIKPNKAHKITNVQYKNLVSKVEAIVDEPSKE